MFEHTPGPWRIIEPQEDKLRPYGVQMGKEGGFMVPCYTVEQSKHNSKLIAAAPEMFDAIILAKDLLEKGNPRTAMTILGEATVKAKGETE